MPVILLVSCNTDTSQNKKGHFGVTKKLSMVNYIVFSPAVTPAHLNILLELDQQIVEVAIRTETKRMYLKK
jgi:hypothetical protein